MSQTQEAVSACLLDSSASILWFENFNRFNVNFTYLVRLTPITTKNSPNCTKLLWILGDGHYFDLSSFSKLLFLQSFSPHFAKYKSVRALKYYVGNCEGKDDFFFWQ